jgi:hypothetical protein
MAGGHHERVKAFVLKVFEGSVNPDLVPEEALDIDPNDDDADPSVFYSTLDAVFGVADEDSLAFDGYGGTVRETIDFIARRWKGGELPDDDDIPWDG